MKILIALCCSLFFQADVSGAEAPGHVFEITDGKGNKQNLAITERDLQYREVNFSRSLKIQECNRKRTSELVAEFEAIKTADGKLSKAGKPVNAFQVTIDRTQEKLVPYRSKEGKWLRGFSEEMKRFFVLAQEDCRKK